MAKINNYILVCGGTGCRASRSEEIIAALRRALDRTGESERTRVIRTGCFGFCEQGPIVKMIPDNTFYVSVKPEDAEEIVREHVVKGRKVERLLYTAPDTGQHVPDSKHMKFYKPHCASPCGTAGSSTPRTSANTSPATATQPWPKCSACSPTTCCRRSSTPACGGAAEAVSPPA